MPRVLLSIYIPRFSLLLPSFPRPLPSCSSVNRSLPFFPFCQRSPSISVPRRSSLLCAGFSLRHFPPPSSRVFWGPAHSRNTLRGPSLEGNWPRGYLSPPSLSSLDHPPFSWRSSSFSGLRTFSLLLVLIVFLPHSSAPPAPGSQRCWGFFFVSFSCCPGSADSSLSSFFFSVSVVPFRYFY